jgi:hypothetical protein
MWQGNNISADLGTKYQYREQREKVGYVLGKKTQCLCGLGSVLGTGMRQYFESEMPGLRMIVTYFD